MDAKYCTGTILGVWLCVREQEGGGGIRSSETCVAFVSDIKVSLITTRCFYADNCRPPPGRPPPIDGLQHDLLISIVEKLGAERLGANSLKNLRLVDKRFNAAIQDAAIQLCLHRGLTNGQLMRLGSQFSGATKLDLTSCHALGNDSLSLLPAFWPQLRALDLSKCEWLTASGISHLAQNLRLESLSLISSELSRLPDAIAGLTSLQCLVLRNTPRTLRGLPEALGSLTSLHTLQIHSCDGLTGLPESIGALSLLQSLDLSSCYGLVELPNSISELVKLETLDLSSCHALRSLPEGLSCLPALRVLDLRWCSSLPTLPAGLRRPRPQLSLLLKGCPAWADLLPVAAGHGGSAA